MNKFLAVIFILFTLQTVCFAEEVLLENSDNVFEEVTIEENAQGETKDLTLYEKIKAIRTKEYNDLDTPNFLLDEILTKKFESGIIENIELYGSVRSEFDFDIADDDYDTKYRFSTIHTGVRGKFRGSKTYYETMFRLNGQHDRPFMSYLMGNMYIANKSIPHHTVIFGSSRTPTGREGGMSVHTIPFVARSQISRNIGNVRKFGLRVQGDYDLIDYDLGGYSSDTYWQSFFPGGEFTGWINLKPLGKTDGRYGKLNIGGGISTGQNNTNYFISGAYVGYEYKKFFADFEWSSANGYNSSKAITTKHADGFYTTVGYKLTPKLHILARYDEFRPDKNFSDDKRREYTAGLNWYIKGQGLKVMLNYVFCQNDKYKDSHRIILGTQILL